MLSLGNNGIFPTFLPGGPAGPGGPGGPGGPSMNPVGKALPSNVVVKPRSPFSPFSPYRRKQEYAC